MQRTTAHTPVIPALRKAGEPQVETRLDSVVNQQSKEFKRDMAGGVA